MLSNIIGVIWIIAGVIWVLKPQALKNRLARKVSRRMRRVIFGVLIVFGLSLVASVMKVPGILSKVIGIAGLILAIKGIMLITSKASDKMLDWWSQRPLMIFRIQGIVILVIGIALVIM